MIDDYPYLVELWSHSDGRVEWTTGAIAELLFAGNTVGEALTPGFPEDLAEWQTPLRAEWATFSTELDDETIGGFADRVVSLLVELGDVNGDSATRASALVSMVGAANAVTYAEIVEAASHQWLIEAGRKEEHARRASDRSRSDALLAEADQLRRDAREYAEIAARHSG